MSTATELLRRALDYIDQYDSQGLEVYEEIEAYLSAEPEANEHSISGAIAFTNGYYGGRCTVLPSNPAMVIPAGVPLYTRPEPSRKPMTEKEMDVGFNPYRMRWLPDDQYFVAGVRWAEKHHGISGEDQ